MSRIIAVSLVLVAGCAQVHELGADGGAPMEDAAARACLPAGVYTVPIRVVSTSPSGCVMPMPMPGMMRLPPQASDFSMMCPMPISSLVANGCSWSIDDTCDMMGGTITTHVDLDGHAPAPTGVVHITIAAGGGTCSVVVALGD